ncbi:MAG: PAS domain-containing sensor histidine kinase, partial [Ignavibacteria bacterium]
GESGPDYSRVWYAATGGTGISILSFVLCLLLINTNIRAHKPAEELTGDLSKSEDKHSSMIANISDVVCILDANGIVTYNSHNVEKCFGWQWQDIIGTDGWLMIHPDDLDRLQKEFSSLLEEDNRVKIVECRLKCKDGNYKPVRLTGVSLINDPVINGVLLNYHDITERRQAEEALRLRESYLSAIIENQSGLFWLKDPEGRVLMVNRKFSDLLGFDNPEKLVGKTDFDLWTRELADKYIAEDRRVTETKKIIIVEDHILDNGRVRWSETFKAPVIDNHGEVIGTTGYSVDITGRKQAEEALKKSIQRLELAMNTADMAWWEIELPSGRITFGERKAGMLGFPPEKFKHYKDFLALVHPDDYKCIMGAIRGHIYGAFDKYETEYRISTKSDGYKWFYNTGTIVKSGTNEKPAKITGLVLDITERKTVQLELLRLNEELRISKMYAEDNLIQEHLLVEELIVTKEKLEKINSEKDRFFSIVAHDLRGPFQNLTGLTELIAEDITGIPQDKLSGMGKMMHATSENLFKLLDNLLEWARMQQGAISFEPVKTDLFRLVSQNIDLIGTRGKQKGIEIINEAGQNRTVKADADMLNTVLRNLLSNAVKFTRQGGKVIVMATEAENNMIEVSVTDNGIGMPEALSEKLFNVAEKVGRTGTDGEQGTGLGLLLCKEFVEKHGGRIRVESEKEKGSTFYFTIPAA